jgi:hypothetical protein
VEPTFCMGTADAEVVFHALRYYAADLVEAFVEDDESPLLDDAAAAADIADRLQGWLVASHQSLLRDR